MILYANKQTIENLNIPMIEKLSQFNKIMTDKVKEEYEKYKFSKKNTIKMNLT